MKNFISTIKNKKDYIGGALLTASAMAGTALTNMGFCAPAANTTLSLIFKKIGIVVGALGVVLCIFGIVHYAAANSEGDGPAKHKAVMQIASGGMVLLIGAILIAGGFDSIINTITAS